MTPQRSPVSPPPKRRHHPRSTTPAATSSTHAPSSVAISLPNEIISEILSRVPAWSACRFRCVSKEWRALISDPSFVAQHMSRRAEPLLAIFSSGEKPSKGSELRLMDIDGNVVSRRRVTKHGGGSAGNFSASCLHDLICFTDDCTGAHVVDPAAGEVVLALPRLKQSPIPHDTMVDLTTRMNTATGFGRAVPSGAYKVVRLVDGESCWVLTLGDSCRWKPRRSPPTRVAPYSGSVTVVNGVLYALASDDEMDGVVGDMVHCLDLESEEWTKTIEGPQGEVGQELWKRRTKGVRLAELKSTLCMVQSEVRFTNIWLLAADSNKEIWVKTFSIPMAPNTYLFMPLGMTQDGRSLLFHCSLFRRRAQAVRIYNPDTKTCTTVTETPDNLASKIGLCNLQLGSFISAEIS